MKRNLENGDVKNVRWCVLFGQALPFWLGQCSVDMLLKIKVGESNPKAILTHSIESDMSMTKHQEAAVDNAGPWPLCSD